MEAESKIRKAEIHQLQFELKKAYELSFKSLESITSIRVALELDDGRATEAEVVPLFGYSDETRESIVKFLEAEVPRTKSRSLAEARKQASTMIASHPFACSPLLTAIDLFSWSWASSNPAMPEFIRVGSVKDPDDLLRSLVQAEATSGTLKIKLSGKHDEDGEVLSFLSKHSGIVKAKIRLDVNQAYTFESACEFLEKLAGLTLVERVEYLEQPFKASDWKSVQRLLKCHFRTPIMLDESIVTEQDLKKAAELGVSFVKLKLFKQGGLKELLSLSQLAKSLGLKVVIGNGVATQLSNNLEIKMQQEYPELFWGASEATGFKKLKL